MKINEFDMRVVINCLQQMMKYYSADKQQELNDLLLFLLKVHDTMNPNKRKRIRLEPNQKRLIVNCLNDWRNFFISAGEDAKAAVVGETILEFF